MKIAYCALPYPPAPMRMQWLTQIMSWKHLTFPKLKVQKTIRHKSFQGPQSLDAQNHTNKQRKKKCKNLMLSDQGAADWKFLQQDQLL